MQRQRGRRLGVAVVVAVLVLGAAACGTGDGGPRASAAESWRRLAAAPLSPRVGHSAVWTGSELLIWGGGPPGSRPEADGAAYDPAADRWRRLPPAPLAGRLRHAAVWTGSEMLLWGGVRPARAGPLPSVLREPTSLRCNARSADCASLGRRSGRVPRPGCLG
jgi:hypothetical protein